MLGTDINDTIKVLESVFFEDTGVHIIWKDEIEDGDANGSSYFKPSKCL